MQTEDEIIDKLTREGYLVVFPWQALPGEVDFPHAHMSDSVQVVLSGEITFQVDGADSVVRWANARSICPDCALGSLWVRGVFLYFCIKVTT